ncbi:MAG: tetratricopeptide repeat protein [Salibacteraceae bacterium]|nr:tetratricopeptide repeat protein [Salibacteraceae bacterium]|tara:strand:+ start:5891 stop:6586 length:696 start_codon:yes stop_codon:yes gene_type:complete
MAKNKQQDQDEVIVDIGGSINKTEQFIEDNKKSLSAGIGAIVVVVALFFGYTKLYLEPLEQEASIEIWKAQQYFQMDSLDKALYGDGNFLGLEDVRDQYGATKAGALADYYIGLIYLKQGDYDAAIENLSSFSSGDMIVSSIAQGAIGDAQSELGDVDAAASAYMKAANLNKNEFSTPIYLMKAGKAFESIGNYDKAKDAYKTIMDDYPESSEGRSVEKYYYKAKTLVENN